VALAGAGSGEAAVRAPVPGPAPALVGADTGRAGDGHAAAGPAGGQDGGYQGLSRLAANGREAQGWEAGGRDGNGREANRRDEQGWDAQGLEANGRDAKVRDSDGQDGDGRDSGGQEADGRNGSSGQADGRSGGPPVAGLIRQADGSPASGAAVTLIDASGRQAGRSSAGPDGSFRIAAPTAGMYTLIAMAAAHQPQATTVRVGELPVRHDVTLKGSSRLTGTARTADGRTIPDARVMLLDQNGSVAEVATTGADGSYAFDNLPPGDYTVVASGYPPVAQNLKITSGQPHTHDPVLGHPED
jgi:hypothetical protein